MIAVKEILNSGEWQTLEPEWRELEAQGASPTVFQTWAWQNAWLDHFGRGAALRTLVFMDWREVVGIAPLVVRRAYGLPLRRLQWIGTGVSDYLDLLIRPGYEDAVRRAFFGYLASKAQRFWDVADLHQIREDSAALGLECPLPGTRLEQAVAPYRPLPGTLELLHEQWGKKLRSNLRYARRVLERDATVEFVQAEAGDLEPGMNAFFALHAKRWRSRWQPGVLFGKAVQQFHRQAARDLLAQDALRLYLLRLDGQIVSTLYCFAYGGVGYYYLGGFDPALSRKSVGTLLTAHAMEEALKEGCHEFDFLRGQEPYKYRWDCRNRVNTRLIVPGRGIWAGCSLCALGWEQRIADAYEARAHGGGHSEETPSP